MPYYRRMRGEAPELLAANANAWLQRGDGRRMVRTALGEGNKPQVRAFLSDRYRPLSNIQLLEAVLPLLSTNGIRIESCELTEKRLYVKAISERITGEIRVGEVVQSGVVLSNSEIGFGAVSAQSLIFTLRCTNGMIIEDSSLRQNHVGRRLGEPGDSDIQHLLSDETRMADDRAFWLKLRDVVKASLDEGVFRRQIARLQAAAGMPITNPALDQVVEVTAKRFGLSDGEGAGILSHLIRGGDLTLYGLSSAVTRFSQEMTVSYDRATDLERIGGKLIELPKADWARISAAASSAN